MSNEEPDPQPDTPRFRIIKNGAVIDCDREEFIHVVGELGEQGLIPALSLAEVAQIQAAVREHDRNALQKRNPLDHAAPKSPDNLGKGKS